MSKMIGAGPQCRMQSGMNQCNCCNPPAGKYRREKRRYTKRVERRKWKKQIAMERSKRYG